LTRHRNSATCLSPRSRQLPRLAVALAALVLGPLASGGRAFAADDHSGRTSSGHPSPAAARAVTVDPGTTLLTFDEFPVGTGITTQYRGLGIDFGGDSPFITTDTDNPTSPVLSGSPRFSGAVRGTFVLAGGAPRTVSSFVVSVGFIDTPGAVSVTAYDSDGRVLVTTPITGTGIVDIPVRVAGIASFLVSSDGNENAGFALDNLRFPQLATDLTHVALGDSFSSGEGNPPFDAGTDTSGDTCHRSASAWPRLLDADAKDVTLAALLACSGAGTDAIAGAAFKTEPPQLAQLAALTVKPDLVTITIGGNDVAFGTVLPISNVLGEPFCSHRLDQAYHYIRERLGPILASTYRAVRTAAGPNARVVVVGYPNLMNLKRSDAIRHCPWVEPGSWAEIVQVTSAFDQTIAAAARGEHVEYVSALRALRGHELCTADSWVYPIGLFGGQLRGHPTLRGQQAIADTVDAYLHPQLSLVDITTTPAQSPTMAG
jgi:lysophospholipase L1-like esterase